jgi:hypothetical protein
VDFRKTKKVGGRARGGGFGKMNPHMEAWALVEPLPQVVAVRVLHNPGTDCAAAAEVA